MPKYNVKFIKYETYKDIEADSPAEAEDIALDYYYNDKLAFTDDKIDKIEIEEVKD